MPDDFIDRIAALVPADVLERYAAITSVLSERREELWALEQELMAIGRKYGVPDIDDPGAPSNAHIRESLQTQSSEINSTWASAPAEWRCPCCRRGKPECARLGTKGQMLGKLVAHHDHIEEFMDVVLSELSKELTIEASSSVDARRFVRRGIELFSRFDRIVICEDCNNAEANGKSLVGADHYFTFTPREIAAFIVPVSNRPHEVNKTALAQAYAGAKVHYDKRIASLRRLAEQALRGTAWYEHVEFEDRDEQIERKAKHALQMFGLRNGGYGTVRDIFFPDRKIDAKHAPAWRLKKLPPSRLPRDSEIEFVIRGNRQFEELAADWRCPCCGRHKRETVRWSQNSKQFMFVLGVRNIPDASERYGTSKVVLCDACNHVFRECIKELRTTLGEQGSDCSVGLEEIRSIIRPKPFCMHEVDAEAAQALVEHMTSLMTFE